MNQWVIEGSLGSILFNSQIITEEDVQAALAEQQRSGGRFGEALVRLGIVTSEDINWALSHRLDIPYIRLNRDEIDPAIATVLPEGLARRYCAVPIIRTGEELRVALADPLDHEAISAIEAVSHAVVAISIADEPDIREMLDYLYGPEQTGDFGLTTTAAPANETAEMVADPTGERFLEWLLSLLIRQGYRSLTLAVMTEEGRLSGLRGAVNHELGRLTTDACVRFLKKLRKRAQLQSVAGAAARGSLESAVDDTTLTFQINLLQGTNGEVVTLNRPVSCSGAPLPHDMMQRIREAAARPGLLLVSLPAEASHSLMEQFCADRATPAKRMLLLGEGTPALRSRIPCVPMATLAPEEAAALIGESLEHRPDILFLENAGDLSRINAAGRAALRGVQVLAETGSGITETFSFIFTAWRRSHLFTAALRALAVGVVIPTLCPSCREALPPGAAEVTQSTLLQAVDGYCHAPGCADCRYTGNGGSKLLVDVITFDRSTADLLDSSDSCDEFAASLAQRGLYTIREQASRLLTAGEISPETYVRVVTA